MRLERFQCVFDAAKRLQEANIHHSHQAQCYNFGKEDIIAVSWVFDISGFSLILVKCVSVILLTFPEYRLFPRGLKLRLL